MFQPPRNLEILLVEPDPQARERVQQALTPGFNLRCARSLAEARRCLDDSLPDVLVCEAVLPDTAPLEICRQIRGSPVLRQLPVMLLTSLSTVHDKVAGFEAGADDYVVKPFDPRSLSSRIRLLARLKRMEQDRS